MWNIVNLLLDIVKESLNELTFCVNVNKFNAIKSTCKRFFNTL